MYKQMVIHQQMIAEALENERSGGRQFKKLYKYHLEQLKIFNTERLIHLLIMLFVGVYMIVLFGFALILVNYFLIFVAMVALVLFGAYIFYYFKLENIIQKLNTYSYDLWERATTESKAMTMKLPPIVEMILDKATVFLADFLASKRR